MDVDVSVRVMNEWFFGFASTISTASSNPEPVTDSSSDAAPPITWGLNSMKSENSVSGYSVSSYLSDAVDFR